MQINHSQFLSFFLECHLSSPLLFLVITISAMFLKCLTHGTSKCISFHQYTKPVKILPVPLLPCARVCDPPAISERVFMPNGKQVIQLYNPTLVFAFLDHTWQWLLATGWVFGKQTIWWRLTSRAFISECSKAE